MKSLKFPIIIYFGWQILVLIHQIYFQPLYLVSEKSASFYQRLFLNWTTNWDGAHYIDIGMKGYNFPQQAFFPLWPVLIKTFSWFGSAYIASFTLSLIFSFLVFVLFYLLAEKLTDKNNARYALILFACFPTTMFLRASYTEGLFLTLVLLSFLFLENKKYFLASIFAGFLSATKVVGFTVSLMFLLIKKPLKYKIPFFLVSLSGLFSYMLFLYFNYGDPLYFGEAQKAWCLNNGRCGLVFPLEPIFNYTRLVLMGWIRPTLSPGFLDWVFSVMFLLALIPIYTRLGWRYFIYSAIVLLVPLSSGSISAMIRYVLVVFPAFFVFPRIIRSWIILLIISLFLLLIQLRFIVLFINNNWVA